ncbi:DUF3883 domain-containing protein [Tersicoccus sp. Bi-70]|uniref:DUF3883 domain-containing protein n=1 Tax=Tersicoccus sp. Bi-70 TaxID=1897634 RepID=UPI000975BC1F|nr:DUF3883 domain-containing protein [Tersicoccus sp. Bi-70]OMH34233.1 hypothetical protein BGP79_03660 [Tersicoccus sp. Bi-70]
MPAARGSNWTVEEVQATVDSYFTMLELELRGEPYSKTEFRTRLQETVNRSKGSIEFKHQNISAVIQALGGFPIDGYKPRSNVQGILRDVVASYYDRPASVGRLMDDFAGRRAEAMGAIDLVQPTAPPAIERTEAPVPTERRGHFIDYQQREESNRSLGLAGELAVVKRERTALLVAGKPRLADRVEHVSQERGDGLGYDVLSFEPGGKERFIEVKTTRSSEYLPFIVSRNEVRFSDEAGDQFHLHRIYRFGGAKQGFYTLTGSLEQQARLEAETYRGWPASV